MKSGTLQIWTVYERPRDYPDKFVARLFNVPGGATTEMFVADTLQEVRALLPPGLYRMARYPADEPQIVEVWL